MKNVLIVEDDKKLNDGIMLALRSSEYQMFQSRSLEQARLALSMVNMDLIILDINLPDGNGLLFLSDIRRTSAIPVIILTANNMETDIVSGLELGANDYITKPFSLMVLRARVNVQFRKVIQGVELPYIIDDFQFDFKKMQFIVCGIPIELSKTEQRLLRILLENKGNTLTRSFLIDYVWSGDHEFVDEHALTMSIKRLRDKLNESPSEPKYIKTVYGIGYSWAVL